MSVCECVITHVFVLAGFTSQLVVLSTILVLESLKHNKNKGKNHQHSALTSSQRRPSSCAESRVRGQPRPPNYVSDRDDLRLRVCVQLHLSRRRPDAPGAECAPAPQHVVRQLRGAAATPLPVLSVY
nr:uncharacterized protein LOC113812880 [Penaeus vannamei]